MKALAKHTRRLALASVLPLVLLSGCEPGSSAAATQETAAEENAMDPSAPQTAPGFSVAELFLRVPTSTPGYATDESRPESLQGVHRIDGWVNVGSAVRITNEDPLGPEPETPSPLHTFRQLLEAYKQGDGTVDAVADLHAASARDEFRSKLSAPELRQQWLPYVTSIHAITPLALWREGRRYICLMRLERAGVEGGEQTAMIFDADFQFLLGKIDSTLYGNLALYFQDGQRRPEDLLVNYQYLKEVFQ
ncbi:MAG: hypothetical protein AAF682_22110 [Planctomycetota bacterium]